MEIYYGSEAFIVNIEKAAENRSLFGRCGIVTIATHERGDYYAVFS